MKNAMLAFYVATLVLTTSAFAGVNGSYKVRGSETEDGTKYTFTGTVTVSKYKSGNYVFTFNDGDKASYKFSFNKPLKETTQSQTVSAYNNTGTSSATFYQKKGKYSVKFTYKSKDGSVRGFGAGSK